MALVDACRTRSADTRSVLRVRLRQPVGNGSDASATAVDASARAVPINTIPPNTEKWLRKSYAKTMATVKSYENKCATNYSIRSKLERREQQQAAHQARHQDDIDTLHLHFNGRVAYMH